MRPPLRLQTKNAMLSQDDVHDTASPAGAAGEKQTRKGVTTTLKGKTVEKRLSSASSVGKQAGGKSSKGLHDEAGNVSPTQSGAVANSSSVLEDIVDIKQQLKELTGSLAQITPVITEIKWAYDNHNQAIDCDGHDSWDDESALEPTAASPPQKAVQDTSDDNEPSRKKAKKDSGVLNSMTQVVNKPQQDRENLELVKQLLSKGVIKDARDELLDKFPTPGNCTRVEVVRVKPEIFNSEKRSKRRT